MNQERMKNKEMSKTASSILDRGGDEGMKSVFVGFLFKFLVKKVKILQHLFTEICLR